MNIYKVQIKHNTGSITNQTVGASAYQDAVEWATRNVSNIKEVIGVTCVEFEGKTVVSNFEN